MTNMAAKSQFNIAEAKASLSELVQRALMGEEIVIAKGNKPLLKLVPLVERPSERRPGTAQGPIRMSLDFDETPADFGEYT